VALTGRAGAARNRQAMLVAAVRPFDDAADPGAVSMDNLHSWT